MINTAVTGGTYDMTGASNWSEDGDAAFSKAWTVRPLPVRNNEKSLPNEACHHSRAQRGRP